jgi:hypothetical protein
LPVLPEARMEIRNEMRLPSAPRNRETLRILAEREGKVKGKTRKPTQGCKEAGSNENGKGPLSALGVSAVGVSSVSQCGEPRKCVHR